MRRGVATIFGQDFSQRMIALAQPKMPRARLYCGDFTQGLAAELTQNSYDAIIATYSLHHLTDAQKVAFLNGLLPLNIFSTYYFQALMKPTAAFLVSVLRGCCISGILILLLPMAVGANAIWFAMPITELLVAFYAVFMIINTVKAMKE